MQASRVSATWDGRVEHVVDGDTVDVRRPDGTVSRVRVHGVDCPERGQPFATAARNFTRAMVFGQAVRVSVRDTDRYGRLVGDVRVGTRDLGEALVEAGMARHFRRYSDDPRLAALEQSAQAARRGLWILGQGAASAPARDVRGNVKSGLYHRPSCPNYRCRNCTRVFASESDAQASGFRPASDCAR